MRGIDRAVEGKCMALHGFLFYWDTSQEADIVRLKNAHMVLYKIVGGLVCVAVVWMSGAVELYGQKRIIKPSGPYREYQQRMDSIYQYRIQQVYLDGRYIPATEEEAVDSLIAVLGERNIERIRRLPEQRVVQGLIGSVGRWMIVRWGLEEGSRLSHHIKEHYGVSFPIDIADFLLTAMYRKVQHQPIQWENIAKRIRARRKVLLQKRLKNTHHPMTLDTTHIPQDTSPYR